MARVISCRLLIRLLRRRAHRAIKLNNFHDDLAMFALDEMRLRADKLMVLARRDTMRGCSEIEGHAELPK